jgi:hypothetical protein
VERVVRVVAERARVREPGDDVVVLEVRAGPPVRQDEGQRCRSDARLVHEVQTETLEAGRVDLGAMLRERVEHVLARPPVEPVGPVAHQLLEVAELGAVVPTRAVDLVGPAGPAERGGQRVDVRVGHRDPERGDGHVSPAAPAPAP